MKYIKKSLILFFIIVAVYTAVSSDVRSLLFNRGEEADFDITILEDDIRLNEYTPEEEKAFVPTFYNINQIVSMEDKSRYIYSIDSSAYVKDSDLNLEKFMDMDLKTDVYGSEPKILIFHTHSQEDFKDSTPGDPNETIVGVGRRLANILAEDYGVSVVHDTGQYDVVDGKIQRGSSYENMEPAVEKILEKYPSIEVVLDLHRDGVPEHLHLVTEIDGKPTAKIMFFNGITRYNREGEAVELTELKNPYLEENLAFSLKMFLTANEHYDGLMRKIYIKPYRYSLHLKPKSLLVEVGANTNTVEEAMNAMEPLAKILMEVLD